MKYIILVGSDEHATEDASEQLERQVQEYLDLGWRPCGGISSMHIVIDKTKFSGSDYYVVSQALTHDGDGPLPGEG